MLPAGVLVRGFVLKACELREKDGAQSFYGLTKMKNG